MSNQPKRNGPKFGPGGMHGMRGGEKAKDFKGTLGKIFKTVLFSFSYSCDFCFSINGFCNRRTKDFS